MWHIVKAGWLALFEFYQFALRVSAAIDQHSFIGLDTRVVYFQVC